MTTMSRAHFKLLAKAVADLPKGFDEPYWGMANSSYRDEVACALADSLAPTNPRFDRARFLQACGVHPNAPCANPAAQQIMGVWLVEGAP